MTFNQLEQKLGVQNEKDWHQHENGGGWVYKNATVEKTAFIGPDAIVFGLYGKPRVTGSAYVTGFACVDGSARVDGGVWKTSPLFVLDSRNHGATNARPGYLRIGCEIHEFKDWVEKFPAIARKHNLTTEEQAEYKAIVDIFCKIGK